MVKEHVDFIYRSSKRLDKFLAVVLQLTELIAREHALLKKPVPLGEILDVCLLEYAEQTTRKNIRAVIDPIFRTAVMDGNEMLVRNCLMGVLENAIEYSPKNGEIHITYITENGFTGCEISDQGPGFSEQALKNLFKLFGRGEAHSDQNVGLDLCLAKMIMDAHNGKVEIHNNPGSGASVRLLFPSL